jgi:cytochrome c oxidase assembly factor CtaG
MTTWQLLLTDWHAHPSVLIGCAALALGYAAATRLRQRRAALSFLAGALVLALALLSPLHTLGERYLFSAHMVQHLLLLQAVPPLLLLGLPEQAGKDVYHQDTKTPRTFKDNRFFVSWCLGGYSRIIEIGCAFAVAAEQVLGRPSIAWLLGVGTMWLWHAPGLYNATLAHQNVHIVEHLTFLATAVIFWWPLLGPARRLAPLGAAVYLFAAMAASSVLGIILTFAPPGLYPAYLQPIDELGILPLLRQGWGLTPAADQQLGGLLMWVPGNLAYLGALIAMLARWYRMPDGEPLAEAAG